MKRFTAAVLSAIIAVLCFPGAAQAAGGEEPEVIFEENFESYESGVDVNSTSMTNVFVCDYNSIGDGLIAVSESPDGNLYLRSHVFTQIYVGAPITGAYEFSLDVLEAQGNVQSGVLIRAPKTDAAYYEGDGNPDTSTCLSGIYVNPHKDGVAVNVKTYDENSEQTNFVKNNIKVFALPDGVTSYPYNLKIKDDTEKIEIYCGGELLCSVVMSEPGKKYARHQAADKCFGKAVLYDKDGKELAVYTDPLLQCDGSIVGWSTRVADMCVDNVVLKTGKTYAAMLAVNVIPVKITKKNLKDASEKVKHARELYDALDEEQKALVPNIDRLTKAEKTVADLTPATTGPKEEPTEAPTEAVTESVTGAVTGAQTGIQTQSGEPITEKAAEEIEIKTVDDSLAIWILASVMIAAVLATAGFVFVKLRKRA
ncbi:MAG: hypothetical protein II777_02780 [Clostridia bacterium]|nr:hypothetical protein [Clostridia bacterium]